MKKSLMLSVMLLFVMNGASAQRSIPLSLEKMVEYAETIVHARVADITTGREPGSGILCTWITLDVIENYYGAPANRFTFVQMGGEADGVKLVLPDMPKYSVGEETILLLGGSAARTGFQAPVGIGQGKFVIRTNYSTMKRVAKQITRSPQLLKKSRMTGYDGTLGVDQLQAEIRDLVSVKKSVRP